MMSNNLLSLTLFLKDKALDFNAMNMGSGGLLIDHMESSHLFNEQSGQTGMCAFAMRAVSAKTID